jgi:hypothetical protein
MSVMLPSELAWVVNLLGINWPNVDEDKLRSSAGQLKRIASDLRTHHGNAQGEIESLLGVNSSQNLTLFNALWQKIGSKHMPAVADAFDGLADGLRIGADVIEGMKVAAIAQLAIFATEFIAEQAAAIETFGLSEAAAAASEVLTDKIVGEIFQQAEQQVMQRLTSIVEGPLFTAAGNAFTELGQELLGDALGVHTNVDFSAVMSAGGHGLSGGVRSSEAQLFGSAGTPDTTSSAMSESEIKALTATKA